MAAATMLDSSLQVLGITSFKGKVKPAYIAQ